MLTLDTPTRARLPVAALADLADLRARPDLEILHLDSALWLRWKIDPETIVLRLLPLPGIELFERRDNRWFPAGRLLPTLEVPDDRTPGWKPLTAVLFPARIDPVFEPLVGWERTGLRLVPSSEPRPTRALRAAFDVVQTWCETAPTSDLLAQRAVWNRDEVILLGDALPPLQPASRYWGQRLLLPLGQRLEPELPEVALLDLFSLSRGEIALLDEAAIDILEEARLHPLSRAALRRAAALRQENR